MGTGAGVCPWRHLLPFDGGGDASADLYAAVFLGIARSFEYTRPGRQAASFSAERCRPRSEDVTIHW